MSWSFTPHSFAPRPWSLASRCLGWSLALALAMGCGPTEDEPGTSPPPEEGLDYTHPLPEGSTICGRSDFNELFPYALRSKTHPVLVHYYKEVERETAERVLTYVERGWDYHVNQLGMRAPLTDGGDCGPDEAFDVFVWKGHRSCLVNVVSPNVSTPWEDWRGFMIMDPWGPYGGETLEETVVHEMAHASQAADDWFESPITFEMSALFTDQVYADHYSRIELADFQAHPDWALDYDDGYDTWYMYGSSLYLVYLKDRFYEGKPQFISDMWLRSRNPPGAGEDPSKNEPDFADALDAMLTQKAGTTYVETVPEFSRWRWYTGDHYDKRHFRYFQKDVENLQAAKLTLAAQAEAKPGDIAITENAPMMLGSSYIELTRDPRTLGGLVVSLEAAADPGRRFVVQAVPGLTPDSDGETLDLSKGPQEVRFPVDGKRTLIVTVMPTGAYDPDTRDNARHPFTLRLTARP
jgi:hypothetical protein